MALEAGDTIGPYEIVERTGQGGMATVYKAYHARLDRYVAIKVMHTSFMEDENFLARFEREARIVARLEHPNIVPIYDYSEVDNAPYLVMKYVEGRTLKAHIFKSGISPEEIEALMLPVAEALDYAHTQGVLHRDIKPSNILLDNRGVPYITDFGLARIAQAGESTISHDMMLGTPHYISPEQARGERSLDARTDIYSLGVILYELVVGHVPFSADTPYAIVHGHIYKVPQPPSEIRPELPAAVDAVILRALAKDAADRYPTAREMVQALGAALRGHAPAHPPPARKTAPSTAADTPTLTPIPGLQQERKVERSIDMGEVDFQQIGRQLESGIRKGAEFISSLAARIDEEVGDEIRSEIRKHINKDGLISGPVDEEEIVRRRVAKRLRKQQEERQGFLIHLVVFILVNAGITMLTGGEPVTPMLFFWGIGLFAHGMSYYTRYGRGAQQMEAAIERETERELRRAALFQQHKQKNDEKAKNDESLALEMGETPPVRLTEDGELTDSFVQDMDEFEGRGRS